MKTNTPPKTETQDRIQQLKLGVDWHADHFRVVRMCDGQSPQPAQRFTPASFLLFVQKQLTLANQVFVVYEAGPGGFHLYRQLSALGVTTFVVHPQKLDPNHKGVVTDKTDARELALNLDRYLRGNQAGPECRPRAHRGGRTAPGLEPPARTAPAGTPASRRPRPQPLSDPRHPVAR